MPARARPALNVLEQPPVSADGFVKLLIVACSNRWASTFRTPLAPL
jgi:hypothetical protein